MEQQSTEIKKHPPKKFETLKKTARVGLAIASFGLGSIGCDRIRILPGEDFTQQPGIQEQARPQGDSPLVYTTTAPQEVGKPQNHLAEFKSKMEQKYGMNVSFDYSIYGATDPAFAEKYKTEADKPVPIFTKEELSAIEEGFSRIDFLPQVAKNLYLLKFPPPRISMDKNGGYYGLSGGSYEPSSRQVHDGKLKYYDGSILISIPEGVELDADAKEYTSKLGIETKANRVKQVVLHEYCHGISNLILRAGLSDDEYFRVTDPMKSGEGDLLKEKNPLFTAFSKLEGWELQKEYSEQDVPQDRIYKKMKPDERMIYRATNFKIEEHFAELFSLYFMKSRILTDQERSFFEKIEEGFRSNPKGFAGEVAKNPMLLLSE